ncbi:MAG: ribosome recycling factor [bacterium]
MINEVREETEGKMRSSIEALRRDLATIRTGRASLAILDNIRVDYYGNLTPLNQVATLSIPEPRLITIQPWESSLIPVIEKALQTSDLGVSPNNDGKIIRIPIPQLTEERRGEMVKRIKAMGEDARISIRNQRRDGIEDLKAFEKEKEISEDDLHRGQEQIQKLTDSYIAKVQELVEIKEKDVMTV